MVGPPSWRIVSRLTRLKEPQSRQAARNLRTAASGLHNLLSLQSGGLADVRVPACPQKTLVTMEPLNFNDGFVMQRRP